MVPGALTAARWPCCRSSQYLCMHDSGHERVRAQSLGSQSGLVIDDFTLRKPVGWQPNPGARLLILNQGFQSNYTETFIEARRPARRIWPPLAPCAAPERAH